MNRVEKEAAIRKAFNVPDDEVILESVITHIQLGPMPALSEKDLAWAKKIAEKYEREGVEGFGGVVGGCKVLGEEEVEK